MPGPTNTPRGVADRKPAGKPSPAPTRAVIDSGPLIALFNAADHWHAPVLAWLRDHQQVRLVTTWPVLTEVCALLARRLSTHAALDFLRWVQRGALDVDHAEATTLDDTLAISERFADLPFDLADASVAEAAARLKLTAVLTIDSDFDVYRDRAGKPLVNLLRAGALKRR